MPNIFKICSARPLKFSHFLFGINQSFRKFSKIVPKKVLHNQQMWVIEHTRVISHLKLKVRSILKPNTDNKTEISNISVQNNIYVKKELTAFCLYVNFDIYPLHKDVCFNNLEILMPRIIWIVKNSRFFMKGKLLSHISFLYVKDIPVTIYRCLDLIKIEI